MHAIRFAPDLLAAAALTIAACSRSTTSNPPPMASGIQLQPVATGLSSPLYLTSPPGDARLFIVEQGGAIRIVENGALRPTPFIDLSDSVRLNEFYERISAELRLCFGLLNDPEHLHSPFVDMNDAIVTLLEENRPLEAATQMETYLNLAERTMLKALERASELA